MEEPVKQVGVGDVVIYHDPVGKPHNALVQAVWSKVCINIIYMSGDGARTDNYGRQIEHLTSLLHGSMNKVHGQYWRFAEEAVNEYVPPMAV